MVNNSFSIPQTKKFDSGSWHLEVMIILYWGVFWMANGLDKFFNNQNLILFTWFGKDRTGQFAEYFSLISIPEESIGLILQCLGVWEICIFILFMSCGVFIIRQGRQRNFWRFARYGFIMSALTFTAFSAFDIVVGDRFELMEHNIYMGMIVLSWFVFAYRRDKMLTLAQTNAERD